MDQYFAYAIAENQYSEVDNEERKFLTLKEIKNYQKGNRALSAKDGFITSKNGNKVPNEITVGWGLLVEWNNETSDWTPLKYLKANSPMNWKNILQPIRTLRSLH